MQLTVNGEQKDIEAQSLKELLKSYDIDFNSGGVAVAVNDTVVPRDQWEDHSLEEEDRIEIIRATQGG